MTLFALADWLVSREDASVRQFGLRSLFHFPVYISVGVDPVRGGSKWKRRAYCLICQTIAKSSFFCFSFIHVSLLVGGCDSESR